MPRKIVVNIPLAPNDVIDAGAQVALIKNGTSFTLSDEAGLVLEILSTRIGSDPGDEGTSAAPSGEYASVVDSPSVDRCVSAGAERVSIPVQFAAQDFYTGTDEVVALDNLNYRVRVLKSVLERFKIAEDIVNDRQVSAFVVRQR